MDEINRGFNRRDLLRTSAVGAAGIYGASFLTACGSGGSESAPGGGGGKSPLAISPGPPQGGTPVRGGTLRVGLTTAGPGETLSVPANVAPPDLIRVQQLFDPLFFVGDFGEVKPGLVVEAHPNSDATLWTLRLRDGVEWHDGKPFTADDVVYTIQYAWTTSENLFSALTKKTVDTKGVRKRDRLTVEVPLLLPLAEFPQTTCLPNTWVVQNGTTDYTKPVGTGPFVFDSFTPGVRSVFKANKNYWISGQPYVDELVIDSSFADPNATMNALLSGQVDIMPGPPAALAKVNAEAGKINLGNIEGPGWCAPVARVDRPPFNDKRVIQALKLVSDRDLMVDTVFDGFATPGNDCAGKSLKYWASDIRPEHDPEKAKALLKEAGQESLNVSLQTAPILAGMNEMATVFSQQAQAAGATVNVEQIDPSGYFGPDLYLKRDFGMNIWTVGIGSLPIFYLTYYYPGAPFNETHWGDRGKKNEISLIEAALAELDEAKANEKWNEVQKQQADEGGLLLLTNLNWLDAYGTNVRGIKTSNAGLCNNFLYRTAWLA